MFKFIFNNLNRATGRKPYLILSSGLGLGIGLGLIMALSPAKILASLPQADDPRGLEISRVKSTDIGVDMLVRRGQATILPNLSLEKPAVHLDSSSGIGGGRPIIIQGLNKDYSLQNLRRSQLGDEIFVIGSNGGWYRYTVVEIREVSLEKISTHFSQLREIVILYVVNPWQKTATLIIAKPKS